MKKTKNKKTIMVLCISNDASHHFFVTEVKIHSVIQCGARKEKMGEVLSVCMNSSQKQKFLSIQENFLSSLLIFLLEECTGIAQYVDKNTG
jgi:hypothetical protein